MGKETATQAALVGRPDGKEIFLSNSAWMPKEPLQQHEIAVAVKAVALNPVDSKMLGPFITPGATLGFDAAGVVTATSSAAAEDWGYREGDRVVVFVHGMNPLRPTVGAFAEHTTSWAWATLKIPDLWSFAEAVGGMGGCAWLTVPWALFYVLGLPAGPMLEPLNSQFRHRSGGASYTGTCAIQLLKLAGYTVIATCSAANFDMVRSFGADAVFDYASPTCAEDIRARANNSLRLALDCITTRETTQLCLAALSRIGGRYVALEPFATDVTAGRPTVRSSWVVAMELLGEEIAWPAPYGREANPVARDFCKVWNRTLQRLVDRDSVRLHPQLMYNTGLTGALEGLEDIREKRNGGRKLIYTL